ncbi:MAG: MBL fold metallo-hydrolase [Bacteroidales bacterium]|nr:MBL fold metallo-hydrolase [Bacteroidales bacterium]
MKAIRILTMTLLMLAGIFCKAQDPRDGNMRYFEPVLDGEVVYRGPDVVFRKLSEGTWMGSGHVIASETLYLIEGKTRALLIDTGAKIAGLDKIIRSITDKPVTVVLTHAHSDHSGNVGCFPQVWINPSEISVRSNAVSGYEGQVSFLTDGQKIDLGGRTIEVFFAPGHTQGSTIFLDSSRRVGFSGSSFGSGNLNLLTDFSTFLKTCDSVLSVLKKRKIRILYPGHYYGDNPDTPERIKEMRSFAKDILSGDVTGVPNTGGSFGLDTRAARNGFRINYSSRSLK